MAQLATLGHISIVRTFTMSDPIIAAIITTSGGLAIWLLTHWRKTHPAIHPDPKNVTDDTITKPRQSHDSIVPVRSQQSRPGDSFSHREISDAIEAVPPFHRDSINSKFVGMRVSWRATIFSISHLRDKQVMVSVKIIGGDGCIRDDLVHCKAKPEDCAALILATEGTEIVVSGKIVKIELHGGQLDDCTFIITRKNVA